MVPGPCRGAGEGAGTDGPGTSCRPLQRHHLAAAFLTARVDALQSLSAAPWFGSESGKIAASRAVSRSTSTDTPLVSIITPAHNVARFVGDTIRSVQAQSFGNWEILVADDCSTDETCAIVQDLAAADPRVMLIRQDRNGGPAVARNAALDRARGRYVCFLDSDDLWLPTKLERQLTVMRETGCAISYTAFRRISDDGTRIGRVIEVPESLTYRQLLKRTAIANSTTMVDREQTGPLRLIDAGYDDYILWLSLLRRGFEARGLNEDLVRYRVVGGSISSRPLRSAGWVWRIYRAQEGLGLLRAAWYLAHYGARAYLKRLSY